MKKVTKLIASPLAAIFWHLLHLSSFPACWRNAKITPIPKGPLSSISAEHRPISITSVLSKVYERLMASWLRRFYESRAILPPTQYGFREGLGTCDAMLHVAHVFQAALDSGAEARLVQLVFSVVFDRVNHAAIIYKLKSVRVDGSVLSVIEEFLTCRSHCVSLDGCCNQSVDVVSGVPQGSVLGPLHFILFMAELMRIPENIFVSYADDSILVAV